MDELFPKVMSGYGRNQVSMISATGIPPHIALSNRIVALESQINSLNGNMGSLFEKVFDRLSEVPKSVCEQILERIQVNGAVPITHAEISQIMSNLRDDIRNDIRSQINSSSTTNNLQAQLDSSEPIDRREQQHQLWTWGGRLHMIPESFVFPM